ncbi:uncharacterized protein PG998_011641 [Apiospora kogelbergensis]|uniref:F-box domain-containing protein n=1 Tax=Apiospora kogelbergensis TaxID=1337665 RepID=A0AAW0RBF2_9PEZI
MHDLPDVVWRIVVDYLRPSFEGDNYLLRGSRFPSESECACLATLARLCRVSSRHRAFAERALYHSVPAAARPAAQSRLFAVLQRRPDLARHVRALYVEEDCLSRVEFAVLVRNPARAMAAARPRQPAVARLAEQIAALGDDLPDFSWAFYDAWCAYMVTLMPGLEFLDITMSNMATLMPSLIRDAARDSEEEKEKKKNEGDRDIQASGTISVPAATEFMSRPLSRLEGICIRWPDETRGALQMRLIQDVLLLPRLERFHGVCVDLNTRLTTGRTLRGSLSPPKSSNVRDVILDYSLVEADGLLDLLRTCPLLQKLSIGWADWDVGESALDWEGFGNALREHGSNLEFLNLDCRECSEYETGDWGDTIGDLSGLQRLQYLSLPHDVLLGNKRGVPTNPYDEDVDSEESEDVNDGPDLRLEPLLPRSLKSLLLYCVYDVHSWIHRAAKGLISSQRLPQLRCVELNNDKVYVTRTPFDTNPYEANPYDSDLYE